MPGPQAKHVSTDDAPSDDEYFPAPHNTHMERSWLPSLAAYVPMPQSRHVAAETAPTEDEYLPAPHSAQAEDEDAPVDAEYLPASQPVHFPLPTSALYLPSEHPTHVPLTRSKPALHWQEACPDGLSALAGHVKQAPLPEAVL